MIRLEATAFVAPDTPAGLTYPAEAGKQSVQRLAMPQGPPTAPKPRVLDVPALKWLELRMPAGSLTARDPDPCMLNPGPK